MERYFERMAGSVPLAKRWLLPRVLGFWENVRQFIPRLRFFFFFKWRLTRARYLHSLGQDKSTVAQQAETTVTESSLTSCV